MRAPPRITSRRFGRSRAMSSSSLRGAGSRAIRCNPRIAAGAAAFRR